MKILRRLFGRLKGLKLVELPDYGDYISLDSFKQCVKNGMFTSDDGSGHFVYKDLMDENSNVWDSFNGIHNVPEGVTYIMWFNK